MFYKDKQGIQICQLGIGDVSVSNIEWKDVSAKECVGVAFGEIERGAIDRHLPEIDNKLDYIAGVKFKLLFTDLKSVDVVIAKLQRAKESMINEAQAIPDN